MSKIANDTANNADPDQTALLEQSDLGIHCLHLQQYDLGLRVFFFVISAPVFRIILVYYHTTMNK